MQVAPGVSSDANPDNRQQSTITVYGSSGAENTFLIDGVNTTGVEYGFQGKDLNFEFIQEIDVKTGGYEAEFGKATGGDHQRDHQVGRQRVPRRRLRLLRRRLAADEAPTPSSPPAAPSTGFTRKDFGVDLGGSILKDRLWFFGAYDRVTNTTDSALPAGPLAATPWRRRSDRDLASAKLT